MVLTRIKKHFFSKAVSLYIKSPIFPYYTNELSKRIIQQPSTRFFPELNNTCLVVAINYTFEKKLQEQLLSEKDFLNEMKLRDKMKDFNVNCVKSFEPIKG